jgi:hypothetical protein
VSTRSHISVKVGNVYKTVYCHFDGYLSHVGRILLSLYNNQELAEKLINGGDISSLRETQPMYYEDGSVYIESEQRPNLVEDYLYVFENGKWHFLSLTITSYQELTEEIIAKGY